MDKPQIKVIKADITFCDAEALVNPANSLMRMGGGVAGALKRVAGSVVEEEALKHAPVPVGSAIATSAGRLKSKYIIHAPTMEKPAIKTTKTKVYLATLAALRVAEYLNVRTIAFPAMGAGVGGVPIEESTKAMIDAIREHLSKATTCLKEIILAGLNDETVANFNRALKEIAYETK
ncbi:MAG: macro domain-containing protein [Candidatus Methanomethylicaceae archaeon]